MNNEELKQIIEAVLFAADEPLNLDRLVNLFPEDSNPGRDAIEQAIAAIQDDYVNRCLELKEVGSGYRFQVRQDYAQWSAKLWEERPARYSRATLETLALIAYRQPITRGEIEDVRGVSVSSQIIRSLMERDWIKVVGHRDVPGKPALYATTRELLDYFNIKSLGELPSLAELRDIDAINAELEFTPPIDEGENPVEAVANESEAGVSYVDDTDDGAQNTASVSDTDIEIESQPVKGVTTHIAQVEAESEIEEPLTAES